MYMFMVEHSQFILIDWFKTFCAISGFKSCFKRNILVIRGSQHLYLQLTWPPQIFGPHTWWYILPPFQNKNYIWTKTILQNKSYVWWNFSQTSQNELECCHKQCECCCRWITKSNNNLHLYNNWYLDSTPSTHINAVLCVRSISVNHQWQWMGVLSSTLARRKVLIENYAMHVVSCQKCEKWP